MKKFLFIADFFLAIMIFAGLIIKYSSLPKYNSICVLNPKYSEQVQIVDLKTSGQEFKFFKTGNSWLLEYQNKIYPVNVSYFENLFATCQSTFKAEQKKSTNYENFGLLTSQENLSFWLKDGTEISNLTFGNLNYLTGKIFIKSSANSKVFEAVDVFSKFLQTDLNYWVEPSVYASQFTGLSSKETYLFPRRGPVSAQNLENFLLVDQIKKEFSTGAVIWTKIYKDSNVQDSKYFALQNAIVPPYFLQEEKNLLENLQVQFTLSQSTYQKLKEEN